jgi:hypothetical protein
MDKPSKSERGTANNQKFGETFNFDKSALKKFSNSAKS